MYDKKGVWTPIAIPDMPDDWKPDREPTPREVRIYGGVEKWVRHMWRAVQEKALFDEEQSDQAKNVFQFPKPISENQFWLCVQASTRSHKSTLATRDVLVHGMSIGDAMYTHRVTRDAIAERIEKVRLAYIEILEAFSAPIAAARSEREQQEAQVPLVRPPAADRVFCLQVVTRLKRGDYISAADRERVALVAQDFKEWVERQGLPTEKGTGAWNKTRESHLVTPSAEK